MRLFFKKIVPLLMISLVITGCGGQSTQSKNETTPNPDNKVVEDVKDVETKNQSAWIVYWDQKEGEQELKALGEDALKELVVFGIYFDSENQFIEPLIVSKCKNTNVGQSKYLSFINDKILEDNSSSLKDIDLLRTLIDDDAAMNSHVENIINTTKENGYDGVEIDYEAIEKNDSSLWPAFVKFVERLYKRTEEEKLGLRIVLEPSLDFESIGFPTGPEYVIMMYNLYGTHSGPGPKADKEFIEKTMKASACLGTRIFAFATGGFDWCDDAINEVTETEAVALAKKYNQSAVRDGDSGALCFQYQDKLGESHTVWYGDDKTLVFWKGIACADGKNGFCLWRTGGNNANTIKSVLS